MPRCYRRLSLVALVIALRLSASADAQTAHPSFDVKVTGRGPAVLLIPGLMSTGEVWDTTVDRCKDRLHPAPWSQVATFAGFIIGLVGLRWFWLPRILRTRQEAEALEDPVRAARARAMERRAAILGWTLGSPSACWA